ncbi:MAG: TonB-dependent receptor, partial [Verrucomicrobia bacterium]|nr:TonB-dependent receptor [Cytophagales bacterium]
KKIIEDHLKLSASIRYDKSQNFEGQYSPRASAVYTFLENHNIRASFQTGFRIPTTQSQFIDLVTPQARLLGGLPVFQQKNSTGYNMTTNPVFTPETVAAYGAGFLATINDPAVRNPLIAQATQIITQQVISGQLPAANAPAAIQALATQLITGAGLTANQNRLTPYQFKPYKPERIQAFEVGYKGLIGNKLFIDAFYYYNIFKNFDGGQILLQSNIGLISDANGTRDKLGRATEPTATTPLGLLGQGGLNPRNIYSIPINLEQNLRLNGWGIGINYALPSNFTIGTNASYNAILNEDDLGTLQSFWNTPKYRVNFQFGNNKIAKNVGFNITWRWQDQAIWQSTFVQTDVSARKLAVVPSFNVFDAQVSLKLPALKSIVKVGGSNIFNQYYTQAWGNPAVGGLYYISLTFDEFLN